MINVDGAARAALDAHPMYVVGGRQRGDRSLLERSTAWYGYGLGVILRLDGDGVTTALEYTSKPGTCGPEDAVLFKSASRAGDRLYCCTQTEVVVFALPGFEEIAHVSLTMFNDVHHVVPTATGTVLVAISGMEIVIEMTIEGEVLREWNVLGEDTWSRHDPTVDYRTGVDLKPHRAHPNHVFLLGDEPFASRFELRDAISLVDRERRIVIGGERIHDGVVHDGSIYFTTVDGQVATVDAATLELTACHPLARPGKERSEDNVLGWCRALHIDREWCWIGFTRIRPTKLRQTVSWIRTGGATPAPTRIARYRMSDWQCDLEIDLEPNGLNAVFSILPA